MTCFNLLYPKGNHHDTQSVGPRSMQSFEVGFICFLQIERLICNVVLDKRVSFFGHKIIEHVLQEPTRDPDVWPAPAPKDPQVSFKGSY